MLTQEVNELLTRVGPGTPAGTLLRRYWQPVCLASELTEANPKKRVTIMGEDLVVFRLPGEQGSSVRYGCLGDHCAHRGTSLFYGFVEPDGIRCSYHGWKYDPDGKCLEQPFEKNPEFKNKVCQLSYPVERLAGVLFIYMGPPEKKPLLPRWDVLVRTDGKRTIDVHPVLECNWLQAMENSVDTVHTYYLHGHVMEQLGSPLGRFYYRPIEDYSWDICEWGITKRCVYGGDRPEEEFRPPLVFPNILRIPQHYVEALHWRVPIDDTRTQITVMCFDPTSETRNDPEEPEVRYLSSLITPEGEHEMTSFSSQDKMAWETQGRIFDRSQENLGSSDEGIIMYRKMLREQIELVQRGGEPMALVRNPEKNKIIEFESTKPVLA
ncbi:MAG: Rieske 2Fe-2S domain-containing protein [Deltaproteobacteria bacterium]|nr:Rieske 2Fe-2S domain-containing protein [Deltaproteobacteria bacterium]